MDPDTKKADVEVHTLITDLLAELHNINVLWEIGVIAISLALVRRYGMTGVALGTVVASLLTKRLV